MNPASALSIRGLTMRFPRGGRTPRRRLLAELARAAAGRPARAGGGREDFTAVDRLSLEVAPGEALALVGRNGCGKTTTLKAVAGLLRPDAGEITVRGRVQALIALGAGFNDRLTGLENIRNNAAVLGFSGKRARGIVDAVADFAEIPGFLEAPVGTYSSGMRARLGFAVAVHLEPDVLLIDEILGVGDFAFQNKCFAHMTGLRQRGVTILLVSHSHNKVIQMCDRAAWLDAGRLRELGPAKEVVKAYIDSQTPGVETRTAKPAKRKKSAEPAAARGVFGPEHEPTGGLSNVTLDGPDAIDLHAPASFTYRFELDREVTGLNVTLSLFRDDGTLMTAVSTLNGDLLAAPCAGSVACRVDLPAVGFAPGAYAAGLAVHEGHGYLFRGVLHRFAVRPPERMTWGVVDLDPSVTVLD